MKTLNDNMHTLSARRRARVEARAAELIAEEMSLRELRRAHQKTQVRVAAALGIGQDGISRLESRADLLISTLRAYIEAMGGALELVARFPGREPVIVTGFTSMVLESGPTAAGSRRRPRTKKTQK